jgi:hypothetical protein
LGGGPLRVTGDFVAMVDFEGGRSSWILRFAQNDIQSIVTYRFFHNGSLL